MPVMDSSSKVLMSPITSEMSAGFGLSLARIASAIVPMQATRPANSSAAGSGLTARYSVATSRSCPKKSRRTGSGEIRALTASSMRCNRSKLPAASFSMSASIDPMLGAERRCVVHGLPQLLDQLLSCP